MTRNRVLGLVFAAAAIGFAYWSHDPALKSPPPPQDAASGVQPTLPQEAPGIPPPAGARAAQPSAASAPGPAPGNTEQPLTADAYQDLRRCIPDADRPADMTGLLTLLEQRFGAITSRRVQTTNVHIRMPTGEIRRLQVVDGKFKLYLEDSEGLPLPIPVPDEFLKMKPEDALRKYEARGEKVFEDVEEIAQFGSAGVSANLTLDGGRPVQIHAFLPHASLGCAYDETEKVTQCQCVIPER